MDSAAAATAAPSSPVRSNGPRVCPGAPRRANARPARQLLNNVEVRVINEQLQQLINMETVDARPEGEESSGSDMEVDME